MTSNANNRKSAFAQEGVGPVPGRAEVCSKDEDGFTFHYKLSSDGLALRSVAIVDEVPELRFDALHKVPTITEEDVAIALRLASDGIRPEFSYISIPLWHPFSGRQFKHYCPQYLRGTSVGNLLSDTDWIMKCLSVGARSNDDKSAFWGWQKTSELEGLATRLDFPEDNPPGSIMMSCESAKVQKGENELLFLEEPKMKIVDDSNSLYSKYISEIYPNVAYHDEPRFLKMQELIKLILAAEWLIEKGVRVSKKWMMAHTAKPAEKAIAGVESHQKKARKPPKELIPSQPAIVKVPSRDVSVKTFKSQQHRLLAKCGVGRRYGWHDFGSKEMIMFNEDGVLCLQQQSLMKHHVTGQETEERAAWPFNLLHPPNTPTLMMAEHGNKVVKQLPQSTQNAVSKDSAELQVETTIQPCPPQQEKTTSTKVSVNDYNLLYGHMDPSQPIQPEIPGLCEGIIPIVKTWDELFNETVPWPHVWQMPYIGVGEPVVGGGVTTRSIPVEEELRVRIDPSSETPWVNQYKKCGSQLVVRAQRQMEQGTIRCANRGKFDEITAKFTKAWNQQKGPCPPINQVFVISNSTLQRKWNAYRRGLQDQSVEEHYHGTTLTCNIVATNRLCNDGNCGICGISSTGLDPKTIRMNITFQRFGHGFYLAPNSSKCHDYTQGAYGCRAMLLCDVCPGRKYLLQTNSQQLTGPPPGFNSVYGQVGGKLNYPEIVVYNPDAVMPRYIIVYRKDGVEHPLAN